MTAKFSLLRPLLIVVLLVVLGYLLIARYRSNNSPAQHAANGNTPTAAPAHGPTEEESKAVLASLKNTTPIRTPLPYRIISFHRGRVDKKLIKLAADLGFNGVQIQLEGANIDPVAELAERDAREHIFDYCHSLGMSVTVWVHEFCDLPPRTSPNYLGPISLNNKKLWNLLAARYEWMLTQALPRIDGLVLTVVESHTNVTQTPLLLKVAGIIDEKCRKYRKSFIFRTFVWYPNELAGVMGAVEKLPSDTLVMTKCVPQDWQMRGTFAAEIGRVGGRPQIIEYDIAGEYFLKNNVANCFPDLLKIHFDYGAAHGVSGICVRVDRDDQNVLNQPSEVNLWTLGMLASGRTDNVEDAWNAWATYHYGKAAAPGVIKALKPTGHVVAELLSIGPFSFGETRGFPPVGNDNIFRQTWQNWHWDNRYKPWFIRAETGEPTFVREVASQKNHAWNLAQGCLADLETVRPLLTGEDYQILHTKLLSNQTHLEFRGAMAMADLFYRRLLHTADPAERRALAQAIGRNIDLISAVARRDFGESRNIYHRGRDWWVGVPENLQRNRIFNWCYRMEQIIAEQGLTVR